MISKIKFRFLIVVEIIVYNEVFIWNLYDLKWLLCDENVLKDVFICICDYCLIKVRSKKM